MNATTKPVIWAGDSRQNLLALPVRLRTYFAYVLDCARRGAHHHDARAMKGFQVGVWQAVRTEGATTYRTVYAVQADGTVLVLYCSQRKNRKPC
jgi:phage-related protein